MKYIINYGTGAAAFPTKVLEVVSRAGAIDLRVFLALCASSGKAEVKKLAKTVGCSEDEVRDALSFWRGAGIVEYEPGPELSATAFIFAPWLSAVSRASCTNGASTFACERSS